MKYSLLLFLKHHRMTPVFFALFTEFLILAALGFMALLSLETLLPTFVSARINLALTFGGLLSLFVLHHAISVWLSQKVNPSKRWITRPLIAALGLWSVALTILSLLKFPIPAIMIIISFCVLLGYFFRKTYFVV